jgi:hypothetical protein
MNAFPMPPSGMFSYPIDLSDPFRLVLGLVHPETEPYPLVAIWDGDVVRRLTAKAARDYATWIEAESGEGDALKPVSDALRGLADRIGEVVVNVEMSKAMSAARRARKFDAETVH